MDNQKIQEHVQTVREAVKNFPTIDIVLYDGTPEREAYDAVDENKLVWLQQSIEIIEQQQREIEKLKREYEELEEQAYRWKEESGN